MTTCIIVTGDRYYSNRERVRMVLSDLQPKLVYQGGCKGADQLCREVCEELKICCKTVAAHWTKYGLRGGPIRNTYMLREAMSSGLDLVVAFHDDIENSKGTKHMIEIARKEGIRVMVV